MKSSIPEIARRLQRAQDKTEQFSPVSIQFPDFDTAAAYEVAELVHQARLKAGATVLGRKIGFTNPAMWDRYNVHQPVWGYMYDSSVVHLADSRGICSLSRFAEPKIEPEIAFHFHATPPADADIATLLKCIDWVAHTFEIVQSHYPGWKFAAPDAVADSSLHGMLLVGERRPLESLGADIAGTLKNFSVSLSCDGVVCEVGKGSNVLGSPLAALVDLAAVLAQQPGYAPIRANDLITTGTLTAAMPVKAGEQWRTQLEGIALPGLSIDLTA